MRIPRSVILAGAAGLFFLSVQGCSSRGDSSLQNSAGNPTPKTDPSLPQGPSTKRRDPSLPPYPHVPGLKFPLNGPTVGTMNVVQVFPRLRFFRPIALTYAPDGSDRIFVVEQGGRVLVFANNNNVTSTSTFMNISVGRRGNEEGLLGFAFDPDYKTNGYVYVNYTDPTCRPRRSIVSRFTRDRNNANRIDQTTEKVLITLNQTYSNHNGGCLQFGPDKMLYIGFGDEGSGGDPRNNGQQLSTLHGAILRIDPNGKTGNLPYGIPSDNPFLKTAGARHEIWAYGLRNPWRFSFDRKNGDLWCGDVGQGAREEIDIITKGGNYGWRWYEGNRLFRSNPPNLPFIFPVIDHPRRDFNNPTNEAQSITGGYVYRGNRYPSLRGVYVYADYASGNVWGLTRDAQGKATTRQIAFRRSIASFGEDRDGEFYIVSLNGLIYQLQPRTPGNQPQFPQKLSQTGLFKDTRNLIPADELLEYEINEPFWSDGAIKRRFIHLPKDTGAASKIVFPAATNPNDPWKFPTGTITVKHFELELTVGNPSSRRRLETRVMINEVDGWAGYTYKWNSGQTDADLLPGASSDDFTINDSNAPGGKSTQTWVYPSRANCLGCHTERAHVLGVQTRQINMRRRLPPTRLFGSQLEMWNKLGMFSTNIFQGRTSPFDSHRWSRNPVNSLEDRVRVYLDTNCAMCHYPNGPGRGNLDLRYDTPLNQTGMIGVAPQFGSLGLSNAAIVRKSAKGSSVLYERLRRLTSDRMPPLGSTLVDAETLQFLGEWIDGLK